ncbi:MAG: hypothetical protein FVQ81_18350 [Candidatus Glassbacteria bacterium]|nr:hypothetical protein [Candidatus Glassbacteria bacterium]
MKGVDLEKARREETRWRILKALDAGRPHSVTEALLLSVLDDVHLSVTELELRRELDYLEDRGLVHIHGKDDNDWQADLTRDGVDVVEYTVSVEPGIARPPKNR